MMIIVLIVFFISIGSFVLVKGIKLRRADKKSGYKHTTDIVLAGIYMLIGGLVLLIVYLYKLLLC